MIQMVAEVASSLLFPKVCDTCPALLSPADRWGVCAGCALKIHKIKPPFCPGCGRHAVASTPRCGECAKESYAFDRAYSTAYYEGTIKELLHSYKFDKIRFLHRFLSSRLTDFFGEHLQTSDFDAVLSVPMTQEHKNKRGFNQSEILAKDLAKSVSLPHAGGILLRKKFTDLQSSLGRIKRNENIRGSFFAAQDPRLQNKRVLLVDDVMTTGFTASECAKTLKSAGIRSVTVLTVARGA